MTIRRASLLLPCRRLDDFPSHLTGQAAAELLAAWTALWHPAFVRVTGGLPGWHPADEPPDPASLDGELILIPSVSRQRLASDWCDRLRATAPVNPRPVEACGLRGQTIAAALEAAGIDSNQVAAETAADFLALGYAHLQVELLTRAMRYTSVLDVEQFTSAVVAAANAAVAGGQAVAREELARAFDLLADARNHVYAVDFYVIDVTLLAPTTLGESLRKKLRAGSPTSVLMSGALIEQMAREQPASLAELRAAMSAGTADFIGGRFHAGGCRWESPETLLGELEMFQQIAREKLGCEAAIFGQFDSTLSPLLPEILDGMGFTAALHTTFDGGRLPRAEQCKTRWGRSDGAWLEALSTTPRDVSQPDTWLNFAERLGDTIAHDHVATVLLAGWPGQESEYFDDLRRAAQFSPVLGKLVTLEEYFRVSRETDDWSSFFPSEYRCKGTVADAENPISARVRTYRQDVLEVHRRLSEGLRAIAAKSIVPPDAGDAMDGRTSCPVVLNSWNFSCTRYVNADPLEFSTGIDSSLARQSFALPDVPGCGFALCEAPETRATVPLAEGRVLRNEQLELTVSATTGGIQSLRTHGDRSTRVSQRLVFHDEALINKQRNVEDGDGLPLDSRMIAEEVKVTRNDALVGEITSRGRLVDAADMLLARFTQTVRLARGLAAAIVDVQLQPERPLAGSAWTSYFASRLAWLDEAATLRRGAQWLGRAVKRERIESPEWVEIATDVGNIVCFPLGLPFHRQAAPTWLDTLLVTAGEEERRFQFAIGLDCNYPTQSALALVTAGTPTVAELPCRPAQPRGWFLHVGARNVVVTHLEAMEGERGGIRCRVLETEGRAVETILTGFRPFQSARTTNFRGETNEVLSVVDGRVRFDIGAHRWVQLEAAW